MSITNGTERMQIAFQGFNTHEPTLHPRSHASETYQSLHRQVALVWEWDGEMLRLDVTAPDAVGLEIAFPVRATTIFVNGQTVWNDNTFAQNEVNISIAELTDTGMRLVCQSGGTYHILARASSPLLYEDIVL